MTTTGPNSPATEAENTSVGTDAWASYTNAKASDNTYDQGGRSGAGTTLKYYIKVTAFGFAIAADQQIDGITVEVEKKCTHNSAGKFAKDNSVRLVIGGTISGSNLADTSTKWGTTDAYATYGGASNLWGLTPTYADINGSTFGVVFSSAITADDKTSVVGSVDHIRITITHTTAGGGGPTVKTLAALGVG